MLTLSFLSFRHFRRHQRRCPWQKSTLWTGNILWRKRSWRSLFILNLHPSVRYLRHCTFRLQLGRCCRMRGLRLGHWTRRKLYHSYGESLLFRICHICHLREDSFKIQHAESSLRSSMNAPAAVQITLTSFPPPSPPSPTHPREW